MEKEKGHRARKRARARARKELRTRVLNKEFLFDFNFCSDYESSSL